MIATLVARNLRRMALILAVVVPALMLFEVGLVCIAAEFEATRFAGGAGLQGMVQMLPGFLQDLINSHIHDFSTEALVAVGFKHPVTMTLSIAITVLFATIPAADRESGLLDLILASPVSRGRYLAGCVVCVILAAGLLPATVLAGGAIGLALVDVPGAGSIEPHVHTALSIMELLLALGGIGLLLSVGARRKGQALARIACLLLPLWALDFMAYLWGGFDWLRWISPFAYVDAMPGSGPSARLEPGGLILLGVFVVTTALAARRFSRADL